MTTNSKCCDKGRQCNQAVTTISTNMPQSGKENCKKFTHASEPRAEGRVAFFFFLSQSGTLLLIRWVANYGNLSNSSEKSIQRPSKPYILCICFICIRCQNSNCILRVAAPEPM